MTNAASFHPDQPLRCLLVQPQFSAMTYWNFLDAVRLVGASAISPPLGLMTVAALLPKHWRLKLVDLNVAPLSEDDWHWADIILTGGMLPQQSGICRIIDKANADQKIVVVGGPDPTSQPSIYKNADFLVLGEGEATIPRWLQLWREGAENAVISPTEKPDVTCSPVPRYDLIDFKDYYSINVQLSRGCPFNCEFCDIIELYGRKPRVKTKEQLLGELDRLYQLGYRGWVDIVDDNFIGNKRYVKREVLPAILEWQKKRKFPFYFSTEASMNLADDRALLAQMEDVGFRFVFLGIETPDPQTLLATQKSQNTMRPIIDRISVLYDHGLMVSAGFIMGFDGEKAKTDQAMIQCIEETGICMAMVGLLVALPNTQLSRRLKKEGRLYEFDMTKVETGAEHARLEADTSLVDVVDQTTAGLNFRTLRDRREILTEFINVVKAVYEPKAYMDRVLRTSRRLHIRHRRWMRPFEVWRSFRGLVLLCIRMSRIRVLRGLFWRNFLLLVFRGIPVVERAMMMMAAYLHFRRQTQYLEESIASLSQIRLPKERTHAKRPLFSVDF